ncbi:MAG: 4Fe-4S dicluster domain-containing protein, partial [Synergistales bacterium]|nr:4Fe-4S dicluster domain-containing protein [Synergistales bacterium]
MQLVIRPELCTGCQSCEVACSLYNCGEMNPLRSRISVVKWELKGFFLPLTCLQCERAVCAQVCPVGAIRRN